MRSSLICGYSHIEAILFLAFYALNFEKTERVRILTAAKKYLPYCKSNVRPCLSKKDIIFYKIFLYPKNTQIRCFLDSLL